ncbi:hypothetical protein AAG747_26885 [Rapidithrix thailandica]|uniref:Uncharacterized protein n=1 Tax=Rapidithrix thailandica TaxID=413964 RepID=A0AAW9SGW7_9BACT
MDKDYKLLGASVYYNSLVYIGFYIINTLFFNQNYIDYGFLVYFIITNTCLFFVFSLFHTSFEISVEDVVLRKEILSYKIIEKRYKKESIDKVVFSSSQWYNNFLGYKWLLFKFKDDRKPGKYLCWFYAFETIDDINCESKMIFENLASEFYRNHYDIEWYPEKQ